MEELLGTSIVLPWLVPPAPMLMAMAIAACTLLLSVFAPTLRFGNGQGGQVTGHGVS